MKTMNVAIITLYHNNNNYGAMLQAYALSEVIKMQGYTCDVLKIQESIKSSGFKKFKSKLKTYGLIYALKKVSAKISRTIKNKIFISKRNTTFRENKFIEFRETKIKHNKTVFSENNIKKTLDNYEIFICGSDQVWNLMWHGGIYWLDFVPTSKAKISYAASAGINNFTEKQEEKVKEYLSDFKAISVREKQAKKWLDEILNGSKEVCWTLDPTLLLSRNDWDVLCASCKTKEKYIFVYFLGDSHGQRKFVKKFANKKNLKIITLPHLSSSLTSDFRFCDLNFGDKNLYDVSPEDFISLIKHAEYIFTDSFHGSIFSAIYHKNFFVFKRDKDSDTKSQNSRIYSLMELFGTPERVIQENSDIDIIDNTKPIDYETLEKNIQEKREYSLDFLKNALSM